MPRKALARRDVNVAVPNSRPSTHRKDMFHLFEECQKSESGHQNGIAQMKQIYERVTDAEFYSVLLEGIKKYMQFPLDNDETNTGLEFIMKVMISLNADTTSAHPFFEKTFKFLTEHVSSKSLVRVRMMKMIYDLLEHLGKADLEIDDNVWNMIITGVKCRLEHDAMGEVRKFAIYALSRLQDADNEDCEITKVYHLHLNGDPNFVVRKAVLYKMAETIRNIPVILERMLDVDEKVRKFCAVRICSIDVRNFSIEQRIWIAEHVMQDRSDDVRSFAGKLLFWQWLDSYNNSYYDLLHALNMDSCIADWQKFRKVAKLILKAIFESSKKPFRWHIQKLPLAPVVVSDGEGPIKAIPLDKLNLETAILWYALIDYARNTDGMDDYVEEMVCDLAPFCKYISKYRETFPTSCGLEEVWLFEQILAVLIEIANGHEKAEPIGRDALTSLMENIFTCRIFDLSIYTETVRILEELIPEHNERIDCLIDHIDECTTPDVDLDHSCLQTFVNNLVDKRMKPDLYQTRMKLEEWVQLQLDATEEEDYEKRGYCREKYLKEYVIYIKRLEELATKIEVADDTPPAHREAIEFVLGINDDYELDIIYECCLQKYALLLASSKTKNITNKMMVLHERLIFNMCYDNNRKNLRGWALKCLTAIGLLYKRVARNSFKHLEAQFRDQDDPFVWAVAISGICQLAAKYTFEHFDDREEEEDEDVKERVLGLLLHIYNGCQVGQIRSALIKGFCLLILNDQHDEVLMSKMMLAYFSMDNNKDAVDCQVLAIFFETLGRYGKQWYIIDAMMDTVTQLIESAKGRYNFTPDLIISFVATMTAPRNADQTNNMHHRIAEIILDTLDQKDDVVELTRIMAKSLLDLKIGIANRQKLKVDANALLDSRKVTDALAKKSLKKFISILDGLDVTRTTRPSGATNITDDTGISAITTARSTQDRANTDGEQNSGHDEEDLNNNNNNNELYEDSEHEHRDEDDAQAVANATAGARVQRMRKSINVREMNNVTTSDTSETSVLSTHSKRLRESSDESGESVLPRRSSRNKSKSPDKSTSRKRAKK